MALAEIVNVADAVGLGKCTICLNLQVDVSLSADCKFAKHQILQLQRMSAMRAAIEASR